MWGRSSGPPFLSTYQKQQWSSHTGSGQHGTGEASQRTYMYLRSFSCLILRLLFFIFMHIHFLFIVFFFVCNGLHY